MIAKQTNHGKAANNTATATARAATAKPCRRTDASATGRAGDVPAAPDNHKRIKDIAAALLEFEVDPKVETALATRDRYLRFTCRRCGHKWYPRGEGTPPTTCPACRSPNWTETTDVIHCFKCNHTWATRGAAGNEPRRCANCNALLTRRAIWYNMSLKEYRRSKQYKKLTAIFNRAQRRKHKR